MYAVIMTRLDIARATSNIVVMLSGCYWSMNTEEAKKANSYYFP